MIAMPPDDDGVILFFTAFQHQGLDSGDQLLDKEGLGELIFDLHYCQRTTASWNWFYVQRDPIWRRIGDGTSGSAAKL